MYGLGTPALNMDQKPGGKDYLAPTTADYINAIIEPARTAVSGIGTGRLLLGVAGLALVLMLGKK